MIKPNTTNKNKNLSTTVYTQKALDYGVQNKLLDEQRLNLLTKTQGNHNIKYTQ